MVTLTEKKTNTQCTLVPASNYTCYSVKFIDGTLYNATFDNTSIDLFWPHTIYTYNGREYLI